jgi:hypothetical protein
VNSPYTAQQAVTLLKQVLDANDKVYVVDATNNQAYWNTLDSASASLIQDQWNK